MFYQLRGMYKAVIIDEEDSLSVIYMGLKFVLEDDEVFVLSTETDIYNEVSDDVYQALLVGGLEYGVKYYRLGKNKRYLKRLQKGTKLYGEVQETITKLNNEL